MKLRIKERKTTQSELARRTGYSRQLISHYANNRVTMTPAAMKTISEVLGCDMEDLYQWERS